MSERGAKALGFKSAAIWTVGGYALYLLSQFGILSVLAHLTNPVIVGQFGLALAIATPIQMLTNLGIRVGIATDAHDSFEYNDYQLIRVSGTLVAIILLIAAGLSIETIREAPLLFTIIALGKIVESYSDLAYGVFQKHERMDKVAKSLALRGPATLVLFSIILIYTGEPKWAFCAQLIIWCGVAFLVDGKSASSLENATGFKFKIDKSKYFGLLKLLIPLGIGGFAVALTNNLPRVIIERLEGIEAVGYFSAVSYPLLAGMFFANALAAMIAPRLAKQWKEQKFKAFKKLAFVALILAFAAGLAGVLVAHFGGTLILTIAFGADYAAYTQLLLVIMAALGVKFLVVVLQTALSSQREFKFVGMTQVITFAVTITLCWILIEQRGVLGAGMAILFVSIGQVTTLSLILITRFRKLTNKDHTLD